MPAGSENQGTAEAGSAAPRDVTAARPVSAPMYCRRCSYYLRGQADPHRCPECGRAFDPADGRELQSPTLRFGGCSAALPSYAHCY